MDNVNNNLDEELKKLCDKIMEEETPKFDHKDLIPKGPNIFLAIEVKDEKNITFVCIEREFKEKYLFTIWSKKKNTTENMRRNYVVEIPEEKNAKNIIKFYAKNLKLIKG